MSTRVHLVDASPYVFRAWFSLPDSLTDPEGRPVNAVRGFGDFLLRLVREEQVTHLGVAFDRSLTTSFRNEFYPPYKANRELPPAALEAQLGWCEELAAGLGAAVFADERYEADDLIATLAGRLRAEVVVVSGDKDLAQLASDRVTLFDFAAGIRYGPAEVEEKFGVRPGQIADLLGLMGDKVDNIPGVEGIGRKSAAALLQAFDDVEALYENLDRVPRLGLRGAAGLRDRLQAGREQALLSKRLATLATDAPAMADLRALRRRAPDVGALTALCERLGLEGWLRRALDG